MAEVRNCKKCGKIFTYSLGIQICNVCKQSDEDDFKRVKDYLYENPGSSMTGISMDLNISVEKIKRFLREGRLEISGGESNMFLECEGCGKSINSGRYCQECERTLSNNLSLTAEQLSKSIRAQSSNSKDGGMRYLNKNSN